MMLFSSSASRFVLVLAAAFNSAVMSATMLRGNSPITTAADTPVESVADAHNRMLLLPAFSDGDDQADLAVQSGAGVAFTSPAATINGSVCGYTFLTGEPVDIIGNGDYILLQGGNAYQGGCGPAFLND
jgi:hypothetical protein